MRGWCWFLGCGLAGVLWWSVGREWWFGVMEWWVWRMGFFGWGRESAGVVNEGVSLEIMGLSW